MATGSDDEVWAAVAELWPGLEALRDGGFAPAPVIVAEAMDAGHSPQSAAVQLAASAVSHHVSHTFSPERKQQIVGELKQVLAMSFEESKTTPVDPFVHKVVTAWQKIDDWAKERLAEQGAPSLFLKHIVRALAH